MVLSSFSFSSIKFLNACRDFEIRSSFATSYNFMIVVCDIFNPCDLLPCHFNIIAHFL
jgi:hypothetical protein